MPWKCKRAKTKVTSGRLQSSRLLKTHFLPDNYLQGVRSGLFVHHGLLQDLILCSELFKEEEGAD